MSDVLKPCAHCGGVAKIDLEDRCVECESCPMMTVPVGDGPLADAVTAWNRRADSGWVEVSERLPEGLELDQDMIVAVETDDGAGWFEVASYGYFGEREYGWIFQHSPDFTEPITVTHWRPIPPQPDKESQ